MPKAVIMAGGQGERFWPMTHAKFPKYRIPFYGKKSLLQKTCERLEKVYGKGGVYVITTAQHAGFIREELPKLPRKNILIEPSRRNTAAAIYLSTALLGKEFGDDEIISFYPADHLIENEKLFQSTVRGAIALAKTHDYLVTVGIKPTFPATGYGYIESGKPIRGSKDAFLVKRFVEKPDLSKAQKYLRNPRFFWNGGIFTWKVSVFMESMKRFSPEIVKSLDLSRVKQSYPKVPNISIDYALFEKADNIAICRTTMDWCDVGNWDMYYSKNPRDKAGNYIHGLSAHLESSGCLLVNHSDTPLITLGVSDLVVVQTPRGTLVCRRGRAEEAALLFKKI